MFLLILGLVFVIVAYFEKKAIDQRKKVDAILLFLTLWMLLFIHFFYQYEHEKLFFQR